MVQLAGQPPLYAEMTFDQEKHGPENFPPENFQREDEGEDSQFYTFPRLVVHIDDQAIAAVGRLFLELIPPDSVPCSCTGFWGTARRRTRWVR